MKSQNLTNKTGEVRDLLASDFKKMKSAADVLSPELLKSLPKRKRGERGAQKSPTKISLTVRYSPDVVNYFKATGKGWQLRMDNALKEWVSGHSTH